MFLIRYTEKRSPRYIIIIRIYINIIWNILETYFYIMHHISMISLEKSLITE